MPRAPLTPLSSKLLERMQHASEPLAPWAKLPDECWKFLSAGLSAGLQWKVATRLLDRWLLPETATERRRQAAAKQPAGDTGFEVYPEFVAGIGLFERHYLGGMTGKGWQGDAESYYSSTTSHVPSEFDDLARVLGVFWPDVPPLTWAQVRPLLSTRTMETEQEMYAATSEYAVDQIDALKLFRFLKHSDKLGKVHPLVDWKWVINPLELPDQPASTAQPVQVILPPVKLSRVKPMREHRPVPA